MRRFRVLFGLLILLFFTTPVYAADQDPTTGGKEALPSSSIQVEANAESVIHEKADEDEKKAAIEESTSDDHEDVEQTVTEEKKVKTEEKKLPPETDKEEDNIEKTEITDEKAEDEKFLHIDSVVGEDKTAPDSEATDVDKDRKTEEDASETAEEKEDVIEDTEEKTENKEETEKEETEAGDAKETELEGIELEAGMTLEVSDLSENPIRSQKSAVEKPKYTYTAADFDTFQYLINMARPDFIMEIQVQNSFKITETLRIKKGTEIIITGAFDDRNEPWREIEQPADYADEGEEKQEEIRYNAKKRWDELFPVKNIEPDPFFGGHYLTRGDNFKDTLFQVDGKLTLGADYQGIYIDGNRNKVKTTLNSQGSFFTINEGGYLINNKGYIINGYNDYGHSAPVYVNSGGVYEMNGGRIENNVALDSSNNHYAVAGGVVVNPGGTFNMNNGYIHNNTGKTGGVFVGDLYGSDKKAGVFNMNGGYIYKNTGSGAQQLGGGVTVFPKGTFNLNDGMIVQNKSNNGGGIFASDQYIGSRYFDSPSYTYVPVIGDYETYLKRNKVEVNINGGYIGHNKAYRSGGGMYIDTDHVNINKTIIAYNDADLFGGGIYVSLVPRTQQLQNMLIKKNSAVNSYNIGYGRGNGGGIWNCPTGYVHIGDGHSVYVYDNFAMNDGSDLTFSRKSSKTTQKKNGVTTQINDGFYSNVSPVTKDGNMIKFLERSDERGIPKRMSYTNEVVNLKAVYDDDLKKEAWRNSKVFIMYNRATNGAGIGSNANMETPGDEGEHDFSFEKRWDNRIKKEDREKISIDVFIVPEFADEKYVKENYETDNNLYKYGEIELTEANNWKRTFSEWLKDKYPELPANFKDKGLPFSFEDLEKRGFKYLFIENIPSGKSYDSTIFKKEKVESNGNKNYEIVIKNSPNKVDIDVEKTWAVKDESKIPTSITIYLLKDGKKVVASVETDENGNEVPVYEKLVLTKENGWKGTFTDLDAKLVKEGVYSISEAEVEGFIPTITNESYLVNEGTYVFGLKVIKPIDSLKDIDDSITFTLHKIDAKGNRKDIDSFTTTWKALNAGEKNPIFGMNQEKQLTYLTEGNPIEVKYSDEIKSISDGKYQIEIVEDEKGNVTIYLPRILTEEKQNILGLAEMTAEGTLSTYITNYLEPSVVKAQQGKFGVTNSPVPETPPEEPETPPETPPEEPNNPPEEPETPPETPPEEPEEPETPPEPPLSPPEEPEEPETPPAPPLSPPEVPEEPETPPETPLTPPAPPKTPTGHLPKTGEGLDVMNYVAATFFGGVALLLAGWKKRENEK